MEYVDGHSCAELLRDRGPMSPRDAVEILTQACRGLDYAHRNGVVHRDVKPGNLMVNTDGVVKLADFGIAKAAEQSDITKVGSVLGTAAYLSPEQARGEPAGPGVGHLRARRRLLPADGRPAALRGRVADRPRAAAGVAARRRGCSDEVRDVPPTLAAAVARALARDPARRYEDAAEMEDALRDGLAGVGAHRGSRRDARPARRRGHADARRRRAPARARAARCSRCVEDPPPRAPPRAVTPPAGAASARSPAAGKWVALVLVVLADRGRRDRLPGGQRRPRQAVQLNEDVGGNVDDAVQSFKDLVADNTHRSARHAAIRIVVGRS